jgi:hypothetical protein
MGDPFLKSRKEKTGSSQSLLTAFSLGKLKKKSGMITFPDPDPDPDPCGRWFHAGRRD